MSSNNRHFYKFREFRLDVAERLLLRADAPLSLTPKAFDVLALLVARGGHLVEKDELLRVVWEDAFVEEANVARVVHSLRKTLGEDAENKFIETVPKRGYRFIAEVARVDAFPVHENGAVPVSTDAAPLADDCGLFQTDGDARAAEELPGRPAAATTGEFFYEQAGRAEPPPVPSAGASRHFWALGALAALVLLVGAVFLSKKPPATPGDANRNRSIAVLPLKPINVDSRDSIYELGIAESLILKLSAARELTVRPLSATRKYLELDQNPTDAGREQQVDFVLSSNYQIAGGKILVTAQLIDTATGRVEEVFRSEQDSANVFAMQDTVANEIGNTLLARFGNRKTTLTAKRGTSNEEAYRLYLQAAFIFDQWNKTDAGKAVGYLERAVKLDPNYAPAYVMLAYAYRFFTHKDLGAREQHRKSREAIERALAIDNGLGDAHAVLGLLKSSYENDFDGAEREFRLAVELDPDSPMARALYAYFLMSRGRFDEAIGQNKKAVEIDPAAYAHQINYGMILYYAKRYDEAAAHYRKLLERDKNFVYAYFWMWLIADLQGSETQAFDWFIQYQTQIKAAPETIAMYRAAFQKAGWKGILREIVRRDEKRLETDEYSGLYYEIACFSARLGDKDKAFEFLEKAYRASNSTMIFIKVDPYLDSLHDDPRFAPLVKRLGL